MSFSELLKMVKGVVSFIPYFVTSYSLKRVQLWIQAKKYSIVLSNDDIRWLNIKPQEENHDRGKTSI